MKNLYNDYVALNGTKKMSSFKNKAELIAAIDAMRPKLSKVDRARLRRAAAANGIERVKGTRWTAILVASL